MSRDGSSSSARSATFVVGISPVVSSGSRWSRIFAGIERRLGPDLLPRGHHDEHEERHRDHPDDHEDGGGELYCDAARIHRSALSPLTRARTPFSGR